MGVTARAGALEHDVSSMLYYAHGYEYDLAEPASLVARLN
jgi:hypothetical protein